MAAGCSFRSANFEALGASLAADVAHMVPEEFLRPSLEIDMEVHGRHLTMELCEALSALEPHGQGNPEPLFLLRAAQLHGIRRVGKDGAHLQGMFGSRKLIGFHQGGLADAALHPVDVVCKIGIDTWQGNRSPQLFVEDMRVAVQTPLGITPEPIFLPS